jgi:hypothetical protein
LGCSPIKAVRELGLERRETVSFDRAVYKPGYMLESPRILRYSPALRCAARREDVPVWFSEGDGSDNATGADNQQERLDGVMPSRILRDHMPGTSCRRKGIASGGKGVKIWSDLYGDMQNQAEMTWSPAPCRW